MIMIMIMIIMIIIIMIMIMIIIMTWLYGFVEQAVSSRARERTSGALIRMFKTMTRQR
jgi:hypothetical protein